MRDCVKKVYLITGDFHSACARNRVQAEIHMSEDWWHFISDTWLIVTKETVKEVEARILPHIPTVDRVLIVRIAPPYGGFLPEGAWGWIKEHVGQPNS